jgi:hypothetical protein
VEASPAPLARSVAQGAIGRGRGYGLNSGWLPWVSTSHVLGIWDAEDAGLIPPGRSSHA